MKSSEHVLQKQVVGYLRSQGFLTIGTDVMSGLMFLGNPKNPRVRKNRYTYINHHKGLGYTSGQPDLVILLPEGKTLLVEFKNGDEYDQSAEQCYFETLASLRQHNYVVWRCFEDAVEFIEGLKI